MQVSISRIWAFDWYQNRTHCTLCGSGANCFRIVRYRSNHSARCSLTII